MKPARMRELKVFAIIFSGFFLALILAVAMSLFLIGPLIQWISYGSFTVRDLTNVDVLGIVGILAALACFVAVALVIEGKQSGRW